jgi:iron complex outermembrane receptor protein
MKSVLLRTSAVTIVAAAAFSVQAQAQDASGEDDTSDEIIVTAQFREQRLQDTPLAITAVNAEMIEAKNQTNLVQVADAAPNVSIRPQTSAFGPSVIASIRGIGQNDFNPAYEPGVGIYIDDVYYPQLTGAVFDTLDLERVEILRGPQGTLAGRNSEGGAIKLYSRAPDGEDGGFFEAGFGSRNRISLRGAAEFALTNNLFARVAGVAKQQDGYVDQLDFGCVYPAGGSATFVNSAGQTVPVNPTGGIAALTSASDCRVARLGGVGYQAARGILRWEPSDTFDITLIGDYTNDEHTVAGEVLLATAPPANPRNLSLPAGITYDDRFICGPYCNFMNNGSPAGVWTSATAADPLGANGTPLARTQGDSESHYSGWGLSANMNWELSDTVALVSITGYREFHTSFFVSAGLSPATINFGENRLTNWSFSQELRLNADITDTLFATVGAYYFEQSSNYDTAQDIRYTANNPLQFIQPGPTDAEAKAAFVNLAWEPITDLNITAGLRYTDESKEQLYERLNYDGTINRFLDPVGAFYGAGFSGPDVGDYDADGNTTEVVGALTGQIASYAADRVDYRVSVDYRIIPELMVYGSVATGFKGGGSNPRPFNADQLIPFAPETLTAYELGFKSDLFDRRLRLNVSAFYNDFQDIQISVNVCPTGNALTERPCAARLNAGDAKVKGFELEMSAEPVDGLSLDGSLSYLDFRYVADSLIPSAAAPPVGTNAGGVLPSDPANVPAWKASLGVQYRAELGSAGSITPRLDFYYQDDQFTNASINAGVRTLNFIPSFTTLNGRITWRNADEDLQIALEVTNITDEYYFYSSFDQRGAGSGFRIGQPARPREWALTVRKDF